MLIEESSPSGKHSYQTVVACDFSRLFTQRVSDESTSRSLSTVNCPPLDCERHGRSDFPASPKPGRVPAYGDPEAPFRPRSWSPHQGLPVGNSFTLGMGAGAFAIIIVLYRVDYVVFLSVPDVCSEFSLRRRGFSNVYHVRVARSDVLTRTRWWIYVECTEDTGSLYGLPSSSVLLSFEARPTFLASTRRISCLLLCCDCISSSVFFIHATYPWQPCRRR